MCYLLVNQFNMLHVHVRAAWTWNTAVTWTYNIDMFMQHGYGHAAWTCRIVQIHVRVPVHAACPYRCCMTMCAACSCPMLYTDLNTQHGLEHAACSCLCCISTWTCSVDLNLQPELEQQRGLGTCSMNLNMLQGLEHAALTWTWKILVLKAVSLFICSRDNPNSCKNGTSRIIFITNLCIIIILACETSSFLFSWSDA